MKKTTLTDIIIGILILMSIACIIIPLTGCMPNKKTFTGYIVDKAYTHAHMSNEFPSKTFEAAVIPSDPTPIEERYTIFVANRCSVQEFEVSESAFKSKSLGQRVIINRNGK